MTDRKKVTMKDIAIKANVTTQTVSRALSNNASVHPETKRKVLEIAKSLNYIKNSNASILRSGSSKIIAVFYDNLKNLFFSLMSDFLYKCFDKYGYTIMTIPVFKDKLGIDMYNYALSLNACGIITFLETDDELSKYLENNKFPLLIFGRRNENIFVDYIALDDKEGGRLAAKELIECGGKKFLYISEIMNLNITKERYDGFNSELKRNGFQTDIIDVTKVRVEDALDDLIKKNELPDSIFCFNDMIAFSVIYYFLKKNLKVPNIIGFDALSNEIKLPCVLKSIGVDKEKIASLAAENLVNKIEGKSFDDLSLVLPVKLYK